MNPLEASLQGTDSHSYRRRDFLRSDHVGQMRVDPFLGTTHLRAADLLNRLGRIGRRVRQAFDEEA